MRSGCRPSPFWFLLIAALLWSSPAAAADPPWRIASSDGTSSIQFGFLAQPQAEWLTTADGTGTAKNLYLRRLRLIVGGKVNEKISFFIETDSPNLGKGTAAGKKVEESVYLQDVILTYSFRDEIQLDGGMLLVPMSHNSTQGATTLLAIDYGAYSFLASDPTTSRCGRDYGIQARGYLLDKHVEYRLGVFQGYRDVTATSPFRYSGRAVWYPFEAETGFFYSGTNLGSKRILAIGTSFDHQSDYTAAALDVYWDWRIRRRDGITAQLDYLHYDGGRTFQQLPDQGTWLAEAGYYHGTLKVGPFLQVTRRVYGDPAQPAETRYQAGVTYWLSGHRLNLKLGAGQLLKDGAPGRTQVVLQGQIYMY
jgi:Phosphate-selective porin O and P